MIRRAAAAMMLALLPASRAPVAERWELEITGLATVEHGELRFEGTTGKVVLQSADTLFLPLARLVRNGRDISFTITSLHRTFTGNIKGTAILGVMIDSDGTPFTWNAQRIAPGADRWPIPPRLTIRQLETGSDAAQVTIPGAWRALLPSDLTIIAEYDSLAHAAGIAPWHDDQLRSRNTQIQLGLDVPVRESIRRTLEGIEAASSNNLEFKAIFRGSRGLRLDLNDVALEYALRFKPTFRLDQAMVPIWRLAPGSTPPLDSVALREITWRFWSRLRQDSSLVHGLDSLEAEGTAGITDAHALMRGYDEAAQWWDDAVHWLMRERWIATPRGPRSPQELVQAFWSNDSLALPEIRVAHFDAPEAFPTPSMRPILRRLMRPANAVAPDWLAQKPELDEVLKAWRTLDWGDPFRVVSQGHSRYLTSPAVELRTHVGGLFETEDQILIDPGMAPLLAVTTLIHEWQHLILSGQRLRGSAPAVRENADELRLLEENPWLAEGAAEWATDQILAPARSQAPLLLAISRSRRLAIQALASDDPHALGYRLVRAAAERAGNPRLVRERLTAWLHDLDAFARVSGLVGKATRAPLVLVRPVNAAVIPEVTFLFDGGAALDVHRRLRVTLSPLEH